MTPMRASTSEDPPGSSGQTRTRSRAPTSTTGTAPETGTDTINHRDENNETTSAATKAEPESVHAIPERGTVPHAKETEMPGTTSTESGASGSQPAERSTITPPVLPGPNLPAMPALNPALRGSLEAPTDPDIGSDHERMREPERLKTTTLSASPTKRSPSPSQHGEEPRHGEAPRLSANYNYSDQLAEYAPLLWSPAVREVYSEVASTDKFQGYGDGFYLRVNLQLSQVRVTKRGVVEKSRTPSKSGWPPGELDDWDIFFVEVGYGIEPSEISRFIDKPEAWMATATRRCRGEVRVVRLDNEKKNELIKAKDKDIHNWVRSSAVEAATRSGVSTRALM